jgi:hypothetical protein
VQNHFPIGQPEFLASRSLGEVKAAKKRLKSWRSAWGAAGANQFIGHPDQFDVVVLGDAA